MEENLAMVKTDPAVKDGVNTEEFFEQDLFRDIRDMKSLRLVSETAPCDSAILEEAVYQCLFTIYQKARGIPEAKDPEADEIFGIFEMFFKQYYQHFRAKMEELMSEKSPVKVAYLLGKNSARLLTMLDVTINDIANEL